MKNQSKQMNLTILLFLFCCLPTLVLGQSYSGEECNPSKTNQKLKNLTIGQNINLSSFIAYAFYDDWASSFLPSKRVSLNLKDYCNHKNLSITDPACEEQMAEEADLSTCQFSAFKLTDKNTKSAWCEGIPGEGPGETVLTKIDVNRPIQIWAGYGKSAETFYNNSRPKKINVWLLKTPYMTEPTTTESGGNWPAEGLKVIDKVQIELKDINDYQSIVLPFKHNDNEITFLAIQLETFYPGNKFQDTCITEIKNN